MPNSRSSIAPAIFLRIKVREVILNFFFVIILIIGNISEFAMFEFPV